MSVPKRRRTKGRKNRGRDRFDIEKKKTQKCPKCSSAKLPHLVCPKCGFYKGREVVDTLKKTKKVKKNS